MSRTDKHTALSKRASTTVFLTVLLSGLAACASSPASAQQVSREQNIGTLRLGQRIKVDDGTCPAGQVKEISGTKMTSAGVLRSAKCIPRLGAKTSPSKQYAQ